MKNQMKNLRFSLIFITFTILAIILILNIKLFIPDYRNIKLEQEENDRSMDISNYITRISDYSNFTEIGNSIEESYTNIINKEVFIKINSYLKDYYNIDLLKESPYAADIYMTELGISNYLVYYNDKDGVTLVFTDDGKNIQIDCGVRFFKGSTSKISEHTKEDIIKDTESILKNTDINGINDFKVETFSFLEDTSIYVLEDLDKKTTIYYDSSRNEICGIVYGFKK